MALRDRPTLLLFLGLTVTVAAETPLCELNSDMTRCVCNARVISDLNSATCVMAPELELRDGDLDIQLGFTPPSDPDLASMFPATKLIFNNVTMSRWFINAMIPFLSQSKVNEINILASSIVGQFLQLPPQESNLKTLQLEDVKVDSSLLHPSSQAFHLWLFGSLTSLGLVRSNLEEFDCYWAEKAKSLTHVDLSENPLSLTSLQSISHGCSLSFQLLRSVHLRRCGLTGLQALCMPLSLTTKLLDLDVSGNNFSILHFPRCLQVMPLRMLNLSHSGITEVNSSLSASLEELDLSSNSLEVFNDPPPSLRKLNLCNNRLKNLLFLGELPHLKELNVDGNQLKVLIDETKVGLSTLQQLDVLHAGSNPYHCDCGLRETVDFLEKTQNLAEDHDMFLCATPEAHKGTPIISYWSDGPCKRPIGGAQALSSSLSLTLVVGVLSGLVILGFLSGQCPLKG